MLFSLLKHYLDTDTALKVSQSVYCFTTSISRGVENYFPRLWGTGISDAIFLFALGSGKRRSEIHAWQHKNIRHQSNWSKVSLYLSPSFLSKNQLAKTGPDSVALSLGLSCPKHTGPSVEFSTNV